MKFQSSFTPLFLLSLRALTSFAQDADEDIDPPTTSPSASLSVKVSTSFPQSEIFGIKIINGQPTEAVLTFTNNEPKPISVLFVGGSLWSTPLSSIGEQVLRNLTTTRYNVEIAPKASERVSYNIRTEMHPQDLRLQLAAVVSDSEGKAHTLEAFNEGVGVVEPDMSIFDPQMIFLYLFLAALFVSTLYFIYSTWITTLFPQAKSKGKGGDRARKSTSGAKRIDAGEQVGVVGGDGPAVTSASKAYDESWIPSHHINATSPRNRGKKKAAKGE